MANRQVRPTPLAAATDPVGVLLATAPRVTDATRGRLAGLLQPFSKSTTQSASGGLR